MLSADYTMCYLDVLELAPDVLENLQWDTEEHTEKLKEMIKAKYFNHEISGETIPEFKLFMEMKFNQFKDYYAELLGVYETQINYLDGVVHSESITGSKSGSESVTENVDSTTEFTPESKYQTDTYRGITTTVEEYDLPRSASSENRPSSKTVTTPDSTKKDTIYTEGQGGTDTTEIDSDKTSTKTISGSDSSTVSSTTSDLVAQKKKYMDLLRSVYSEFADKFSPCFITMYN